jgi:hypothetical protein
MADDKVNLTLQKAQTTSTTDMNEQIEEANTHDFPSRVAREVAKARSKHKPINSLHEGYAVILEEVDELWDETRKKSSERDPSEVIIELVQIGAMAQRTAEDVLGIQRAPSGKPATNPEVPASRLGTPMIRPMETAPLDGTYILLFGPSGYRGTPLRCEVCRWDPVYRPRNPWLTYAGNGFSDTGEPPVGWLPLPMGVVL